jgi:hypothetical protein
MKSVEMTIKKISDLPKFCNHPEHNPPSMIVLPPGVYEHTCPGCLQKITFIIDGPHLQGTNSRGPWLNKKDVDEIN